MSTRHTFQVLCFDFHNVGTLAQWEEDPDTYSELMDRYCAIWLNNFSWKKYDIGDGEMIEAKEIVLYAARRLLATATEVYLDVGSYLDLPGALEVRLYK